MPDRVQTMNEVRSIARKANSGFTLLEVMITLSILVTMVYAVSQLIRAGFDVREALSQQNKVTHRFNIAMEAITRDLSVAYIVSTKDTARTGITREKRTIFKLTKVGDSDSLAMTYMAHRAVRSNSKESDISYVAYEVRSSPKEPGRKHLYRGETVRLPSDFKDLPPMALLAEDIASIRFEFWNGESFSKDKWDSTNGDTRDRMPQMIRVTILAWEDSPEERLGKDVKPTVQYSTVVFLPFALDFKEDKIGPSTFSLAK